ncbi:NADPH-dependent FMN reductase [Marinomonas balearica]|uniref:NAD(P)H-dependent FMN reductase n=1 Tax=Marinomonas balearica TaxID=491947 RepID=A0A4R6M7F2_9GAMM|nr:NAD(P)H-dependent oxidoreductase [Marinomonas balearica]TDO97303.1 NAD(P)H-dependent FMN reductase [Marinomonas balearica]
MKLLAFAASNSKKSINKQLATYAASLVEATEVEILDINDYEMPIYSPERNEEGIPELATKFFNKIGEADGIIISFAEYNGSYSAAFKNIFDWVSRIDMKVYQNTPMVLLASSPGGAGAANVLASAVGSAPYFAADVKGSLSVPKFYDVFDLEAGKIKDEDLDAELKKTLAEAFTLKA